MTNKEIRNQLLLASSLMELHGANAFKAKSYNSAAQIIENTVQFSLSDTTAEQLETIDGIGKKVAAAIISIVQTGTFEELQNMVEQTPVGVVEMLGINGLGAKKINTLWKELGIENLENLLSACQEGKVAKLKGFGEKTQEKIHGIALFTLENKGKKLYAEVEALSASLEKELQEKFTNRKVSISGQIRRAEQIVHQLDYLVEGNADHNTINTIALLQENEKKSSPYAWRGKANNEIEVQIKFVDSAQYTSKLFIDSSAEEHLAYQKEGHNTLLKIASKGTFQSEEEIYQKAGLPYIAPVFREGDWELETQSFDNIIQFKDLKGCLHNHSLYSDGKNTILEMAQQCQKMGYEYFGISDHSKSAFYANGLYENKVQQQHKEIDEINQQLNDFKVFKSIESDILNDGELDYEDSVLASFDFIIASIHSNLGMDINKATARLITAIENPYTTMLGHPTGRLLLRREGYPIHHKKVIDACAANHVIIEINANPWRLDIDWQWIQYCMEKGVMLSINPDAHIVDGIYDMYYGTLLAQKGGLTKEMCFNTKSSTEAETYFKEIKKKKGI